MRTFFTLGFALALAALLPACGGGGAETSAPEAAARPAASETESADPTSRP